MYCRYLASDPDTTYRILEAGSAEDGLTLCQLQELDGILLDFRLPDLNGLQFLVGLKANFGESCPPIVMISGQGDESVAVQAIKSGAEDYLVKDRITPAELCSTLKTAIENAELRLALRQSEERFRTSVESMLDCFGVCSAIRDQSGQIVDFRIDYLNAAALENNQMTRDQIGQQLCQVFPSQFGSSMFDAYCQVVETGQSLAQELLIYSDQFGTQSLTKAYDIHASKLGDGFVTSWRDITEKKQTEQALRDSEECYRAIVQDQTELICRFLPDGTLTFVNDAYSRYFGSTTKTLIGQNFLQLIPEADHEVVRQQLESLNALTPDHPILTQEHAVLKPNGEVGWQQWTNRAIFNAAGQIAEFQAVGRDISDRKATELSLQQANERFELAASAVNCLIYDWDLQTNTVNRSRGLTDLFGYLPAEVDASPEWWWQQMHPEDSAKFDRNTIQEQLGGIDRYRTEYRVRHCNGHYLWVEDRGLVVKDSAGQPVRIVGSTSDISERKQVEDERKQAEQALRESEARLKRLIDLNLLGVEFWDADGTILDANDAFLNIVGYTREDLQTGRVNWRALTPPEQLVNSEVSIEKMRQQTSDTLEKEYVRKDGSRVCVLLGGVMFDGSQDRGVSFVVDLTTQKHTERELRHNQERLQRLIETAQIGIAFSRQTGEVLEANQALLQTLGYSREEFLAQGLNWRQMSPPDYHDLDRQKMAELEQNGQFGAIEREIIRKDGTRVPILVSGSRLAGEADEHVAFIVDLTKSKQAEAALQQREALFRGVFESDLIGILFWNTKGQMTDANDAFCRLTGYSREELQSGQIYYHNITPPEYHERDAQKFETLQMTGKYLPIEKEYICKDGSRIPILLGCAFLPGSSDRGVAFVLDIREQKRLEQEREVLLADAQAARDTAELANRTKDEFLAIVSHELRSPLNAILGWTKLLRTRQFTPAKVEQALETIERNTQAQVKLIEDLLDVSRILRGQLSLDTTPVHLAPLVNVVVANGQLAAEAKKIQLRSSIDPEVGRILGDINRLQQIMTNLVTNAVKFTPHGGQVEVALERSETQAAVRVIDTGQGISPEFLPYVFERFRQAENGTTRSKDGLGLGLAIVRHLVELHGGTVQVESPGLGQGATFTVMFPLIDELVQPVPIKPLDRTVDLSQVKILIVDDMPDTCDYLHCALSQYEATVAVANSAAEAYELFQRFAPDVLLSDIGMPEEDGYSLLQRIRQLPGGESVPAIALTAFAKPEDRDRTLRAGFQKHLPKPVEPDALVSAIVNLFIL